MAKRNSSEMQTGNAEGQVRRPKKGASFVGGARPSGLWAVPAAVFFFIFGILPLFIVVGLSFFKWNGLGTPQFAGGQYWAQFIHDPKVMKSVGVTLTLTILGIVTQTPLSLLLGAWAAGRQRYRAVYTRHLLHSISVVRHGHCRCLARHARSELRHAVEDALAVRGRQYLR